MGRKSEWVRDGPEFILTRGRFRARINRTRRGGVTQFWAAITECFEGEWRFIRNLPPCNTLVEQKQQVEDNQFFITAARRREIEEARKAMQKSETASPRRRRSSGEEEHWWHRY